MARKKVAMVQPPPAKPADLPLFSDDQLKEKLLDMLKDMKNDRAYTVLEYHQSWASVHFEGDEKPTIIHY